MLTQQRSPLSLLARSRIETEKLNGAIAVSITSASAIALSF
ncbi:hypothetical protein [Nostoc sp. C117]